VKGFERKNQLFSLCGLNCGLCPMHLNRYCPGCGGGNGNQSCKIAKCSLDHGGVEYCFQCEEYPCEKYEHIDDFDSFVTHRNQIADMEKAKMVGIAVYNAEQSEKVEILNYILDHFNDGRKKTFFCVAVNLLDLSVIKQILNQISEMEGFEDWMEKEQSALVVKMFRAAADEKKIELKLRKKK